MQTRRKSPGTSSSLPFNQWPVEDRAAWESATACGTVLLDEGSAAQLQSATLRRYKQAYGHWLHFLNITGRFDPTAKIFERVTSSNIQAYLKTLQDRNLKITSRASYLESINNVLYHTASDHDWTWLRAIVNRLHQQALCNPTPRHTPPDIGLVYQRALSAMRNSDKGEYRRPLWNSIHYRDALMVAVAAATVLRRRNLAMLDLEQHLQRLPEGWRLAIPGHEVKNGVRIEGPLPDSLVLPLDRYVEYHRPRLLQGKQHQRLFVRYTGDPYTVNSISGRMRKATARLGFEMPCHDFRRSAASTLAATRPALAMIIGHFLGHKGQRTSERFYNRAQMVLSSRRYSDLVVELKAGRRAGTRGTSTDDDEQVDNTCAP